MSKMEIEGKKLVLDFAQDYEFISLITHIQKTGFGTVKVVIMRGKPHRIIETQRDILLTRQSKVKKDSKTYGG